MAGSAVIGALRVNLGLDSAQFSTGLAKAQSGLARFGKAAALGLTAAAAAATALRVALGYAVKASADHADELGKTAQKVGVTVEALSRLEFAAKLSDVSLEGLSTGLRKLADNMADVAMNSKASVGTAFKALGIDVKDAAGNLKSGDAVLAEVADRFSRMEDGALKTSLAIQIFGRSGTDLIPLLNEGADGLKRYADESDRLGVTISTKTAKAAEIFNDNLTRLGSVFEGLTNKVMEAVIPSLVTFTNTLASPETQNGIATITNLIIGLGNAAAQAAAFIGDVGRALAWADTHDMFGNEIELSELGLAKKRFDAKKSLTGSLNAGQMSAPGDDFFAGFFGGGVTAPSPGGGGGTTPFEPLITDAGAAKKALIELTDQSDQFIDSSKTMAQAIGDGLGGAFSRLADAVLSGNDALSATVDVLMDLGKQLVNSAITGFFGNLVSGAFSGGVGGTGRGGFGQGTFPGSGGFFPAFPGLAGGTDNWRGGTTWVGENGPELLNLPRGSQVIPNHELSERGGTSLIRVDLGPSLVAQILKQADDNAVQIVRSQAPLAVAQAQSRRKMG